MNSLTESEYRCSVWLSTLTFWTAFNPLSLFGSPERSEALPRATHKLRTAQCVHGCSAHWTLPRKLFTVQIKKSKNICCSLCNMNHLISFLWSARSKNVAQWQAISKTGKEFTVQLRNGACLTFFYCSWWARRGFIVFIWFYLLFCLFSRLFLGLNVFGLQNLVLGSDPFASNRIYTLDCSLHCRLSTAMPGQQHAVRLLHTDR